MMIAVTTDETIHGNPGERRILPAGTLVHVRPADNLPADVDTKYWVTPVDPDAVTNALMNWADGPGIGLAQDDLRDFREVPAIDPDYDRLNAQYRGEDLNSLMDDIH